MTTKTRIVSIDNSRGIRVRSRSGWAGAAQAMSQHGHDDLLDAPTATRFDRKEWKWR
jgi:hypothetical protein